MYENCFQVTFDPKATEVLTRLTSDHFNRCAVTISLVSPSLETKLPNGIIIYGDEQAV